MERIGILHDEFPCPHDAEAWANFITKFRLNLVVVHGKLFVALELPARDIRDDFFVGRAETKFPFMPIPHSQKQISISIPAAGFLP